MGKLIYRSEALMTPESFRLGHSLLRIKGVDEAIVVEFQGTYYMEMPRLFNGMEIWELTEEERDGLLNRKPTLDPDRMSFWKMVSNNDAYYIAAFAVKISED